MLRAIVTGGASGIGAAAASVLRERGARVSSWIATRRRATTRSAST